MENHLAPSSAMDRFMVKVKHIMPTLVYCLAGTVATTILLRWIAIESGLGIKKEIWEIWTPIVAPWIPITIWLRPKLRILTRNRDEDNMRFGFQILAFIAIAAPCFIGQIFVKAATGKLVAIHSIDELRGKRPAQFYTIENFEVDSTRMALGEDIRTSGKYNQDLHVNFFFVQPFKATIDKYYWYGVSYKNRISNRDSDGEKERKYNELYQEAITSIRTYNTHDVTYFQTVPPSNDLDVYFKAMQRIDPDLPARSIVLEPINKPFESGYAGSLVWTLTSGAIGVTVFALFLTLCRYKEEELELQRNNVKPQSDDIVEMVKYLIPRDPHFMTSIILDINIMVALVMVLSGINPMNPNGSELMDWGALRRDEFRSGEYWRLVTSMFVHGGVVHLLFNIYGLYFASILVEPKLGRAKYLLIYMVSGIVAGFASILWSPVAGVGASGAIFGLFGALLGSLLTDHWQKEMKKSLFLLLGPYVGINLVIGFFLPGVGNAAHIGGLVTGLVFGYFLFGALDNDEFEEESEDSEAI